MKVQYIYIFSKKKNFQNNYKIITITKAQDIYKIFKKIFHR